MVKAPQSQPVEWRATRLGDVAEVFAGIGISRENMNARPGTQFPVIGVRDLQDGAVAASGALDTAGFPSPERAGEYAVSAGDVLVTGRGTILKFGLVGLETAGAIASGNIIVVRAKADAVSGALLAILSSEAFRPQVELLRRGATTLLSLSPKDLANLEIALPPLAEQHRIASLLQEAQSAYRAALDAAEVRRSLARRIIDTRLFGAKLNRR